MAARFGRKDATTGDGGAVPASDEETRRQDTGEPGRDDRFDTQRERGLEDRAGGAARIDAGTMRAARARQREEFGGIHWGAAFFGWLCAAGLGAILTGLLSAAGATLALGDEGSEVDGSTADTIGIAGAIALLLVLLAAYYAGGYVAGRMSRFDGARQGVGAWVIGLVIAVVLAVAGAVLGAEYNVLADLNLPRIPIDEGDVALGGAIALLAGLVLSLLASMAGGKTGERYHRKIDRHVVDDRL